MSKISVIVPIYNVEKYIHRCIDSILSQTYTDFELILVDDGSPDRCGAICDEYAAKDGRIRVIHKENGGLSSARNAGLDVMQGEYVTFIDSDDMIHPQYLELLKALQERTKADITACHYEFFQEEEKRFMQQLDIWEEAQYFEEQETSQILKDFPHYCRRVSLISQCMKLYKKEIFDGIRMAEGKTQEDSLILPYVLECANKLVKSRKPLYHWRVTPGSISRSGLTAKSFDNIEVSHVWAEFFCQRGQREIADEFKKDFLQRTLKYYYRICDDKPELMNAFKFHIRRYRKLFLRYFAAKGMCIRERAAYVLFLAYPKAARNLYMQVYGELYREETPR